MMDDDQQTQDGHKGKDKGKKSKKKPSHDVAPHSGTSHGAKIVPRTDFQTSNLDTGRPIIQCTACGEYTHWSRHYTYDNFCSTCNNHDHATHMCRAPRPKPSPVIYIYCCSTDHRSGNCPNKPWDNRTQPCGTYDTLRNQQSQPSNTKVLGNTCGNATSTSSNTHGCSTQSPTSLF